MELDFISLQFQNIHPPNCMITSHATGPGFFMSNFKFQCFDPSEWCMKKGLLSGDSNPQPLGCESSALTTRPRRLALITCSLYSVCCDMTVAFLISYDLINWDSNNRNSISWHWPYFSFDMTWRFLELTRKTEPAEGRKPMWWMWR